MGFLRRLLARREAAKLAFEIVSKLIDEAQDATELALALAKRSKRDANPEDLRDSLERFQALRGSTKNTKG